MNWEHLFAGHILERGFGYYCEDTVDNLKRNNQILTADVYGTRTYKVRICFKGDTVQKMSCSCPYASDGAHCKHMAAVLYTWDTEKKYHEEETGSEQHEPDAEIEELVSGADEALVRSFLKTVLKNDEDMYLSFKRLINPSVDSEDMKKYKKQVDNIVRCYMGREHYISYYEAAGFVEEMGKLLEQDAGMMLDNKCLKEAFELTNHVFTQLGDIDMDDSDGGLMDLAWQCSDVWEEILEISDKETERLMYEWFISHLDGPLNDFQEECIEQVVMNYFNSPEYLQIKLKYTEQRALEADNGADCWSYSYNAAKWAMKHIALLEQTGASDAQITEYCRTKWKYSEVRNYVVEKCMEKADYAAAVTVLKESLERDSGYPGLIKGYQLRLKEIYRAWGKTEDYKQKLWELVTRYERGNLELFQELKAQYEKKEWENIREKIFQKVSSCGNVPELYLEERLYDRLLEYVQRNSGIFVLQKYTDALKELYPAELLDLYERNLENMAGNSSNRSRYREMAGILQKMGQIKGGKERARKIADGWRRIYRNRPAMMDEIRGI